MRLFFFSLLSVYFLGCIGQIFSIAEIRNLHYSNPEIIKIRSEITDNLQAIKARKNIVLQWRSYTVKKDDNFFLIMAKTMQNQDTLSSVNQLASLWDLQTGQKILIPNIRGIAIYGDKEELSKKYNLPVSYLLEVPEKKNLYFLPGRNFSSDEREYFELSIFKRPVDGNIASRYGLRKDPFTQKNKFHKGIDIACPINSKVRAAASGKVIFKGEQNDYGKMVILQHKSDYISLYGHLNQIEVEENQYVQQGDVIAHSGMTGRTTGPHLHFEVRRGGKVTLPRLQHAYP